MSVAQLRARPQFRFVGRSFMAFVLTPDPYIHDWLTAIDDWLLLSEGDVFSARPFVLDLSRAGLNEADARQLVDQLKFRHIRLIAVEGCNPDWFGPALAPIAGGGRNMEMAPPSPIEQRRARIDETAAEIERKIVELAKASEAVETPPKLSEPASLTLNEPVRSGQIISCPGGDVTVLGTVASGAEIIAGGSIHVYGALKGRAIAGTNGNSSARIFCQRFHAELMVINGLYKTADDCSPQLQGKAIHASLDGEVLQISPLN